MEHGAWSLEHVGSVVSKEWRESPTSPKFESIPIAAGTNETYCDHVLPSTHSSHRDLTISHFCTSLLLHSNSLFLALT